MTPAGTQIPQTGGSTATDTRFVFGDWFRTARALTLPVAYQDPTFANNFSATTKSWLQVVAVGDFNNDHRDDLVLSLVDATHRPYILISRGDGTFEAVTNFTGDPTRQYIRNGEITDLNQDGWMDFVGFESTHSGRGQRDLILLNNQGKGYTVVASPVTETQGHHGGAVGDFNGDGRADILAIREFGYANYQGTDPRAPLIQQSDGSFRLGTSALPSFLEQYALAAAAMDDLNGDGIDDLVLAVSTMAKDQGGRQLSYAEIAATPTLAIALGEAGKPLTEWKFELVGRHWVDAATYQAFVTRFGAPNTQATAGANSLSLLDMNGDGRLDIVVGSYLTEGFSHRTGGFQVFINGSNGRFEDQTARYVPNQLANRDFDGSFNFDYSLADFNADGNKDLLVTTTQQVNWPENARYPGYPSLFIGQSAGEFLPANANNMRVFDNSVIGAYGISYVITGDFNGDGAPDLLSLRQESDFDWQAPTAQARTGYVLVSHLNKALERDPHAAATLLGTASGDTLQVTSSQTRLRGLAGDDLLQGRPSQVDTAVYHGAGADFTVVARGGRITVTDRSGNEGRDMLADVEHIRFSDVDINTQSKAVASSVSDATLQRVIELYVAFFNRTPDADGLSYWLTQVRSGVSINAVAESFYGAGVQYTALTGFSSTMTNADFINVVYRNVLGRQDGADAGGLAYWSDELESGRASRGTLVSTILDSAHTFKGDATWGWVANLLDNKVAVARQVAVDWGLNYLTPDASVSNGMAIAKAVTPTDTAAAIALVGIPPSAIDLG